MVDDLETRIASSHGNLLGAVGVTIEAGLAHQESKGRSLGSSGRLHLGTHLSECLGTRRRREGGGNSGGCAVLTEHLTKGSGPFTCGHTCTCARKRGLHQVGLGGSLGSESGQGCVHRRLIALGTPRDEGVNGLLLNGGVDALDCRVEIGQQRVRFRRLEGIDAHHDVIA